MMTDKENMIILLPFGNHHFNDDNHCQNFVRYMFSQSKGHPKVERTSLNLITQVHDDEGFFSRSMNTEPEISCPSFIRKNLTGTGFHRRLYDDGFYIMALISLAGGEVASNFIQDTPKGRRFKGDMGIISHGIRASGGMDRFQKGVSSVINGRRLLNLDELCGGGHREVDEKVHEHILRTAGGKPILMASHHDQRTAPDNWHTNPFYHVHRLLKK